MIMLEIEWIVKAKPNKGQTVEELEQDFDNLVAECKRGSTCTESFSKSIYLRL